MQLSRITRESLSKSSLVKSFFPKILFLYSCSSLRLGVLAVNLLPQRPKIYRKGAKTQRKETNYFFCFYFKIFYSSLRLGVLAVNLSPQRRKIHRKGAKTQRKEKTIFLLLL